MGRPGDVLVLKELTLQGGQQAQQRLLGWCAGMVLQSTGQKQGGFHNEGRRQRPWEVVFGLDLEG